MSITNIFSQADFLTELETAWAEYGGNETIVILISGKAGVGKTTLQTALFEHFIDELALVVPMSFAKPLKRTAYDLGWDGQKDVKGRKLLQDLGGSLREYDKNTWVRLSLDMVYELTAGTPPSMIIYDDWRFPNESKFIEGESNPYRVIKVRVLAPSRESLKGQKEYLDSSELALDNYPDFDIIIDNDTITKVEFEKLGVEKIVQFLEKED